MTRDTFKAKGTPPCKARECKCDMRTKLVGDGCDVCNPEYAAQFADDPAEAQRPGSNPPAPVGRKPAPPPSPPSAPVGVEAVVEILDRLIREVPMGLGHMQNCLAAKAVLAQQPTAIPRLANCGRYTATDNNGQHYYLNHANTWQTFQGQQPAAVDGAMVDRVTDAVVAWATLPIDPPAEPWQVAELRDVISAALTAQPGGASHE